MPQCSMLMLVPVILSLYFPWRNVCEKYILVSNVTTVDIAEEYCNQHYHTSLASIHSESDNTAAKHLCRSDCVNLSPCKQACSIGANDKQNERGSNRTGWVWNDGSIFNYNNWEKDEPNELDGFPNGEDCSIMWSSDHYHAGTWNDCPCDGTGDYKQRFLCNAPPSNDPSINATEGPTVAGKKGKKTIRISFLIIIVYIVCSVLVFFCFLLIIMFCCKVYFKLMRCNDKIEVAQHTTLSSASTSVLPTPTTPTTANEGYQSTGLESDILSDDDQEDDDLYSKPVDNIYTTDGVPPSGNIVHFYYMEVVQHVQEELYHEKQKWEMCLMHALNGLLQKQQFTVKHMNAICKELAPQKVINPHKSLLQTGNYDANVLMMALAKMYIEVQWYDARKKNELDLNDEEFLRFLEPANQKFIGFILNKPIKAAFMIKRRHWIAIKEINGEWYNLDSKLKEPQQYKNAQQVTAYLVHSLGENGAELMICRQKIQNMKQKKVKMNVVLNW